MKLLNILNEKTAVIRVDTDLGKADLTLIKKENKLEASLKLGFMVKNANVEIEEIKGFIKELSEWIQM